jgi:hypothetical protein
LLVALAIAPANEPQASRNVAVAAEMHFQIDTLEVHARVQIRARVAGGDRRFHECLRYRYRLVPSNIRQIFTYVYRRTSANETNVNTGFQRMTTNSRHPVQSLSRRKQEFDSPRERQGLQAT